MNEEAGRRRRVRVGLGEVCCHAHSPTDGQMLPAAHRGNHLIYTPGTCQRSPHGDVQRGTTGAMEHAQYLRPLETTSTAISPDLHSLLVTVVTLGRIISFEQTCY